MARFKLTRNTETDAKELFQVKLPKTLVADIHLMVTWAKRDRTDVVAEMLRFALEQETEFQAYKKNKPSSSPGTLGDDQPRKSPHPEKTIQASTAAAR